MLDKYMQQWSAIQTARAARLAVHDVFLAYSDLTGDADAFHVEGYLSGLVMLSRTQRDLLAQAVNELLDGTGSTADGAHYSDEDVTERSGYEEYLRDLTLSPDGYDFAAPPVGDHSTSAAAVGGDATFAAADHSDADGGSNTLDEAEFRRCQALHESGLLESGAEERFDRITRRVRDHFGVSSASIALITEDMQFIKSVVGPIGQDLPRDLALCARTIEKDRTLVIADASVDPDWQHHPLVIGGPEVRFYAGHPITTAGGWRIGTLCLIDDRPRTFTDGDVQVLRHFAARVQLEIWV